MKQVKHEAYAISKLKPYEFNSKQHTSEQLARLAESISRFGFQQPIVVDENDCILIGHGRHLAAQLLNLESVPVWVLAGLSEDEKRAFRIADNKIASDTGFDVAMLQHEISLLQLGNFDLNSLGLDFKFEAPTGGDGERDTDTTKDKLDIYNNNQVKRIVLYFDGPKYDDVLKDLDAIMTARPELANNTEVFLYLLELHKKSDAPCTSGR